jgi:6,7-dimethyl-8-ribityllumazine synthase
MVTRQTSAPAGGQSPAAPATPRPRCRLLLIEARFYDNISDELMKGAVQEIEAQGIAYDRISVPGALEIPQVLAQAAASGLIPATAPSALYAGAIALGCIIRGETSHYDIVCNNANHWLMDVAIRHNIPLGNAILTVDNKEQALARARGGREGKGADAVRACLALVDNARLFAGQSA